MSDLDALDLMDAATPTTPNVTTRRCRHPKWKRMLNLDGDLQCRVEAGGCGHVFDPERQRTGRRNRQRGNAKERDSAKRNGTVRSGQFGGKDDYRVSGLFAFQNKSMATSRFPGWMTRELDALRLAWPDLEPVLHVEESPGPGRRPRRLYVVDERTWLALHGPTKETA